VSSGSGAIHRSGRDYYTLIPPHAYLIICATISLTRSKNLGSIGLSQLFQASSHNLRILLVYIWSRRSGTMTPKFVVSANDRSSPNSCFTAPGNSKKTFGIGSGPYIAHHYQISKLTQGSSLNCTRNFLACCGLIEYTYRISPYK
jgi:hypothetical protein